MRTFLVLYVRTGKKHLFFIGSFYGDFLRTSKIPCFLRYHNIVDTKYRRNEFFVEVRRIKIERNCCETHTHTNSGATGSRAKRTILRAS